MFTSRSANHVHHDRGSARQVPSQKGGVRGDSKHTVISNNLSMPIRRVGLGFGGGGGYPHRGYKRGVIAWLCSQVENGSP